MRKSKIEYEQNKGITLYLVDDGVKKELATYDPKRHLDARSALTAANRALDRGDIEDHTLVAYAESLATNTIYELNPEDRIYIERLLRELPQIAAQGIGAGAKFLDDIKDFGQTKLEKLMLAQEHFELQRIDLLKISKESDKLSDMLWAA